MRGIDFPKRGRGGIAPHGRWLHILGVIVTSPAAVKPDPFGGWSLDFWIGDIADMDANSAKLRTAIYEVASLLSANTPAHVEIAAFEKDEVDVEGALVWNGNRLELVLNAFDGLVALTCPERGPLDNVFTVIRDRIHLAAPLRSAPS
jgi:hypothetical protein